MESDYKWIRTKKLIILGIVDIAICETVERANNNDITYITDIITLEQHQIKPDGDYVVRLRVKAAKWDNSTVGVHSVLLHKDGRVTDYQGYTVDWDGLDEMKEALKELL